MNNDTASSLAQTSPLRQFADLMPDLAADDFVRLKEDIRRRGVMVPVEIDEDGVLLDGKHRRRAVDELRAEGVDVSTPPPVIRRGMADHEKRLHAVALNLARRHLTDAQKVMLGKRIKPDVEARARERQGSRTDLQPTSRTNVLDVPRQARDEVAAQVGLGSGRTFERHAKLIDEAATIAPEVVKQAESGQATMADVKKAVAVAKRVELGGDEWYTPEWLFDGLGIRYSIDVCSPTDRTHVSTPAGHWYTEADDGLAQPWEGTVWCNPPYSTPAPWAERMVAHGDGLLLTHVPINAAWAGDVWHACDGVRFFQAMEFVRADGSLQRPGYWLMLAAFGPTAAVALAGLTVPDDVAANPRRVPSPMWGAM